MTGTVGERVRQVRQERGWTQAELAKRAKIAQSSVSELERGDSRGSAYIVDIAVALGVSPFWLNSGKGRREMTKLERDYFGELSEREQQAVQDYIKFLIDRRTT